MICLFEICLKIEVWNFRGGSPGRRCRRRPTPTKLVLCCSNAAECDGIGLGARSPVEVFAVLLSSTIAPKLRFSRIYLNVLFWWLVAGATPVPIPNTEVKPRRGDGTLMEGRVASRRYKVFKIKTTQQWVILILPRACRGAFCGPK